MPLSSLGSKEEEEEDRCENAMLRSETVWTGLVVAATGTGGCGLRSPVRLSKATGVMEGAVTSFVLTWGFTWFLWRQGTGGDEEGQDLRKNNFYSIAATSVSCAAKPLDLQEVLHSVLVDIVSEMYCFK